MVAYFDMLELKRQIITETVAYAAYAPKDHHIFVHSSTKDIHIGKYIVFHVKANFPMEHFDWMIVAKNLILNSGSLTKLKIHKFLFYANFSYGLKKLEFSRFSGLVWKSPCCRFAFLCGRFDAFLLTCKKIWKFYRVDGSYQILKIPDF